MCAESWAENAIGIYELFCVLSETQNYRVNSDGLKLFYQNQSWQNALPLPPMVPETDDVVLES